MAVPYDEWNDAKTMNGWSRITKTGDYMAARTPIGKKSYRVAITSQGQITIPAELRRALRLDKPGTVELEYNGSTAVMRRPMFTLEEVFRSIPAVPGTSEDFDEEIEAAMRAHIDEKYGSPVKK